MVTVMEQARITRRGGAAEDEIGDAPRRPAADYPTAARFLWAYLRREARRNGEAETYDKRPGWLWEGTLSAAVRFLWPGIGDIPTRNAITAIGKRLRANGSIVTLAAGRHNVQSTVWISEDYAPNGLDVSEPRRPKRAPDVVDQVDEPAAAVDVDEPPAPVAPCHPCGMGYSCPEHDPRPPAAAPEAPQVVEEPPAPATPAEEPPAPAEAPQDVEEPPARPTVLEWTLTDRERALVAMQRRLDDRELELVDRELELVARHRAVLTRELIQLDRERVELVARRRRLAREDDSAS